MKQRLTLTWFSLFLAAVAAAQEADPVALNASEIQALFAGNTLYAESQLQRFENEPVRSFQIHLREEGTLVIRNFDGNTDTGVWSVNDEGHFCNQYQHTRRGRHKCFAVQRMNGHYRLWDVEAQRPTSVFTVQRGNPEGL